MSTAKEPRPVRRPNETATQRLGRLLDMVPWLLQHRGVPIDEAAAEFGVSTDQLVDDLELLFVCGTPGYGHAELIDASWETGYVYLDNADDIAAPMRLTRDEAVTLTAGLQALGSTIVGSDVAERTLAKLRAAAATSAEDPAGRIALDLDDGSQHPAMDVLKDAVARRRRVHLRYYVATRDESTERDVDLMRILNLDGQWYVEGWCHRARGVRLFRLDRIDEARVLEVDGTPPASARPRDLDDVFVPGANDLTVVLEASRWAAWIADYYPNEGVERGPDGSVRVTLKVADPALVQRLVLRLGGEVRVLEPAGLAASVAREARAALEAYPDAPAAPGAHSDGGDGGAARRGPAED
jgi:proteasome accessory factor C